MTARVRWYFDTGVWVTPLLGNLPAAAVAACLHWQRSCADGQIVAVASTLVWDEVTFVAGRRRGLPFDHAAAASAGRVWRSLPNLDIVAVDAVQLQLAQALIEGHRLKPRDCLHAASAMLHAEGRLLTLDGDFPARLQVSGHPPLVVTRLG